MTSTPAPTVGLAADATAGRSVLARLGAAARVERDAGREVLRLLVEWAGEHPGPGLAPLPLGETYADHEVELAGPGAPGVSEFDLVEVAALTGKSAGAAKRHLGDALELAHRLPRTWARVNADDLDALPARRIAQHTKQLSARAAAWVDAQVAPRAHRIGPRQLDRLIDEALVLFDPETALEVSVAESYVRITPAGDGVAGVSDYAYVDAKLPLTDALALEQAVKTTAHDLLADYPDHDLDERRALALGRLADHAITGCSDAGSDTGADAGSATRARSGGSRRAARELSLVVHLDQPDLRPAGLARVHTATGAQHLVTAESVAAWCLQPGTKVTLRPVIDLDVPISCPGYVPSPALRAQVGMLSPTCCFPYCPISAERCDDDHIIAWDDGGMTDTWNLAPLCRLHHRVKTFTGWTYHQPLLGVYEWSSPHGHRYRRDRNGTINLDEVRTGSRDREDAAGSGGPAARPDPPPIDWC